jgi:hypothetical protein
LPTENALEARFLFSQPFHNCEYVPKGAREPIQLPYYEYVLPDYDYVALSKLV